MTTPDELDTLLEKGLATAVADVSGDARLTQTLVDGAVSRLRRRRRFGIAAASVTTSLAILATALVGWQLHDGSRSAAPATQVPSVAPTYTVKQSFTTGFDHSAWAQSLPRGTDAPEAFVSGVKLISDGQVTYLGKNVYAQLLAPLPGGWFAEYGHHDRVGNQIGVRYGLLSRSGAFRAFAFMHTSNGHQTRGWAASPDGSRVTYGGSIVDVATGRWVRYLPDEAVGVQAWTTIGIAYWDNRNNDKVWLPGSQPRSTDWGFVSSTQALRYSRGCTTTGLLGEEGVVQPVGTVCGDGISAASAGGFAVTASGTVIDLRTGSRVGSIPVPPPSDGFLSACCRFQWTDDNRLLFGVTRWSSHLQIQWVLVSCEVADGDLRCTRASQSYAVPPVTEILDK